MYKRQLFYRLNWVQRCWPRATPDFGSVSVLQDIPRHPDTRLFEVRRAFKRRLLLGFQAHIRAYIAFFSPPAALRGPLRGASAPLRLRATDAEPLINALVYVTDSKTEKKSYLSHPRFSDWSLLPFFLETNYSELL